MVVESNGGEIPMPETLEALERPTGGDFSQLPPSPEEWIVKPTIQPEPIQRMRELRRRIPLAGVEAFFYKIKA